MAGRFSLFLEAAICRAGDLVLNPFAGSSQPGVVALIFHSITPRPRFKIDVTPESLAATIELIQHRGHPIISLGEASYRLRQGLLDRSYVVLTFDDGYRDFLVRAAPILRRYNAPATVSILPHHVDSQEPFDFDTGTDRLSMSWEDLNRLVREYGDLVTIANHSHRHRDFSRLTPDEAEEDIRLSQQAIQDHLGLVPSCFTCPFGISNPEVAALLRKRFEVVLGGVWARNTLSEDLQDLHRITVLGYDRRPTLRLKAAGAATTYQLLRSGARRLVGG